MPIELYCYNVEDDVITSEGVVTLPGDPDSDGDGTITEAEWDAFLTGGTRLSATYSDGTISAVWDSANNANIRKPSTGTLYAQPGLTDEEVLAVIDALEQTNNTGVGDGVLVEDIVYCFGAGALLRCPDGDRRVEDLTIGDLVETLDHGAQPVRWIGKTTVSVTNDDCPIRVCAGALGENMPSADLIVSPHHRMAITGWRAEVLFGEAEVLVAARDLVNDETIRPATDLETVTYYHILFDRHEIVFGNGALSESFHPAESALDKASHATRDEIYRLFPELRTDLTTYGATARMVVGSRDARMIMQ